VVELVGEETRGELRGFTITGGRIADGAAVHAQGGIVWLTSNAFLDNRPPAGGATVLLEDVDAVVAMNRFAGNSGDGLVMEGGTLSAYANHFADNSGVGIRLADVTDITLVSNRLNDCGSIGIWIERPEQAVVGGNIVERPGVHGIHMFHGMVELVNNLVVDAGSKGMLLQSVSGTILNNTLVGSKSDGIYLMDCWVNVWNNLVSDSGGYGFYVRDASQVAADYNLFAENDQGEYGGDARPGEHDPCCEALFLDGPLGRHYLSQVAAGAEENSPAVDAGIRQAYQVYFPDDPALEWSPFFTDEVGVWRGRKTLAELTTRVDELKDEGIVDVGYHYGISRHRRFGLQLLLKDTWLQPGDPFALTLESCCPKDPFEARIFVALEVAGSFWLWPSWVEYPQGMDSVLDLLHPGERSRDILHFEWPDVPGSMPELRLWAAIQFSGGLELIPDVAMLIWGYGESP